MNILSKKPKQIPVTLYIHARLQPEHREQIFAANLRQVLREIGSVAGGTTQQSPSGEVEGCAITMHIQKNEIADFAEFLDSIDMLPKGSCLRFDGLELPIGTLEGLGLYLSTQLPDSVYEAHDINDLIEALDAALDGCGRRYSYWEGSAETALYYYGGSFAAMQERVQALTASEPLCEGCRIVQLA